MRLSRRPSDPGQTFGHAEAGIVLVMIDREEYWKCGFVIPKGAAEEIRSRRIEQFRERIATLEPFFRDRLGELRDRNDVSLLTGKVDRLKQWSHPGLLCIGDAAHAMSPVGGVGINLAIHDAVAAASILAAKLTAGSLRDSDLLAVQQRREFPTRAKGSKWGCKTKGSGGSSLVQSRSQFPFRYDYRNDWPFLRRIPARVVGLGFGPEHIRTPEASRHRG